MSPPPPSSKNYVCFGLALSSMSDCFEPAERINAFQSNLCSNHYLKKTIDLMRRREKKPQHLAKFVTRFVPTLPNLPPFLGIFIFAWRFVHLSFHSVQFKTSGHPIPMIFPTRELTEIERGSNLSGHALKKSPILVPKKSQKHYVCRQSKSKGFLSIFAPYHHPN